MQSLTAKPHKRSVLSIDEFCGWPRLKQICESYDTTRDKSFPAALFSTGGRVSEVLELKPGQFEDHGDYIVVKDFHMVKQKKINPYRTFSFPSDEPTWSYLKAWIDACLKYRADKAYPLYRFGRKWAYQLIKAKTGLWDHWFRSQRASQLSLEYGLRGAQLREWFKVRDITWDARYSKLGETGLRDIIMANKPKRV